MTTRPTAVRVCAIDIRVGRGSSEGLDSFQHELYRRIARAVHPRGEIDTKGLPKLTESLPFPGNGLDQTMRTRIAWPRTSARVVLVVDLGQNPDWMIREPVLRQVADRLAETIPASGSAVVLLPAVPHEGSPFWDGLDAVPRHRNEATIIVVDHRGGHETRGSGSRHGTASRVARCYVQFRAKHVEARSFKTSLVRRLGHFALGSTNGPECSRYYFDASLGVSDLSDELEVALRKEQRAKRLKTSATAVLASPMSSWMLSAGTIGAERAGLTVRTLDQLPRAPRRGSPVVVLTDFLRTGFTAGVAVDRLSKKGWSPSMVVTALRAEDAPGEVRGIKVRALAAVDEGSFPRTRCDQCRLGLPHTATEPLEEDPLVRPFDFWYMIRRTQWERERYGFDQPEQRFSFVPDLSVVFERYGDWIAIKYAALFDELKLGPEPVVVCPQEPAVEELIARVRSRFENRLTHIAVPRSFLKGDAGRNRALRGRQPWTVQLRRLGGGYKSVVVIDEFNGSGRTARRLVNLLDAFQVQVAAYAPFLN